MNKEQRKNLLILFLILFVIGTVVYLSMRGEMIGYVFAHLAGASIVGLLALAAAYIAGRKGYSAKLAFHFGFTLSLLFGLISVFIFYLQSENNQFACGGSPSLFWALVTLTVYALMKKRVLQK